MFRKACKQIMPYTLPIITCRKTVSGKCSGSIGTFVVINKDGWIVTAAHIVDKLLEMMQQVETLQKCHAEIAAIKADSSIPDPEKKKRINKVKKPANDDTEHCAQVWSLPLAWKAGAHPVMEKVATYQPVDVAVVKLDPWDPAWVTAYPVFKDPSKDFDPGAMLCRTGFPFHHVQPRWDDAAQGFDLPPGTFPAPLFPIEGIFTRTAELAKPNPKDPDFPFPYKWIETSSPGLKGQSGGPIFDEMGSIWGIQCQTVPYDLGFTTVTKTPQFLNVGVGVHPEVLFRVFADNGIDFQVSDY
jgi:hypothetical protein